jgi:hypothetical protein
MRVFNFRFLCLFSAILYLPLGSEPLEYNPWNLQINERIIHRKHVSHLVIDTRKDHYRLTLILSDRFPYNFKSRQHSFFLRYLNEDKALEVLKLFDKQLDSGKEVYIRLNGSEIIGYHFVE